MLIIGASGRARHGKTIFCVAIANHVTLCGGRAKIYDVGEMIRQIAVASGRLPDIPRESMKREHLQVLIDIGKEKRELEPNYWVMRLLRTAKLDNMDVALCPNLRLPMEAASFRQAGGYVVRCTRLNKDGSTFISEDRPPNDITETALQFWPADVYLTTVDGDTELMERMAITTYDYLREKRAKHVG